MKKIFLSLLLGASIFTGCYSRPTFEQSTQVETKEQSTPAQTEEVTPSVDNNVDIVGLFQSILLNEETIKFDDWDEYGSFYLKDWRDDYYAFSIVDYNHDGQNEVCLYSKTSDGHGLDIISYKDGEAVLLGVSAYSQIMYSDGYIGFPKFSTWVRSAVDVHIIEDFDNTAHGYYNGTEISKEELEIRKKYYSTEYATKHELTKENIMKYVVLEAEQTDSIPENIKPGKVDYFTLSAIQQVLLNKKSFVDENGKRMRVENLDKFYSDGKTKGATFFTVWDMNKDGNDEVIVKLEGDEISHVIFTEKKGVVYGKEVSLEEFSAIFTDNTYNYNHEGVVTRAEIITKDASYIPKEISAYKMGGSGIMEFYVTKYGILWQDNTSIEYDEIMAKYSKEVVPAHLFTVDNVVKVLPK